MTKNSPISLSSYQFLLEPKEEYCYQSNQFENFNLPPEEGQLIVTLDKPQNAKIPVYLLDKRYYTPAFIFHCQKNKLLPSAMKQKKTKFDIDIKNQKIRCQFTAKRKYNQFTFRPIAMLTGKSSKKCYVCNKKYQSYKNHIHQLQHQVKVKYSRANRYIHQLCDKYRQKNDKQKANRTRTRLIFKPPFRI